MLNNTIKKYLRTLNKLQTLIFSFYIQRDFGFNRFLHEKKLIEHTSHLMHKMSEVRKTIDDPKLIANLEALYENVFSLDLLKDRLVDHATFEVCEQELRTIDKCLCRFFMDIIQDKRPNAKHKLDVSIQALEVNFQNTIQVVAADPMVFLFFIKNLYSLSNMLNNLS